MGTVNNISVRERFKSIFDVEGKETGFEVRRQFINILDQGIFIDLSQKYIQYRRFGVDYRNNTCSSMKIMGETDTFDLSFFVDGAFFKTDNSLLEVKEMDDIFGVSFSGNIKQVQDDEITKTIAFEGCVPSKTGKPQISCKFEGIQTKDSWLVDNFNTQLEFFTFEELAKTTNEFLRIKGVVLQR